MAIIVIVGTEDELKHNKGRVGLTTSQASARLGISDRAFYKLVDKGEIAPYDERLGPLTFYEEPDIERLRQDRLRRY